MTEPQRRRVTDRHPEVHLPRSLVIAFVISFAVLMLVAVFGVLMTNRRFGDAATDSERTGRCLLLQALEQRALTYVADQAAADFHGYDYDDGFPFDARPPDLVPVMVELEGACDELVPAAVLQVPVTPGSTVPPSPTVVVVPGEDGQDGGAGAPGPAGPPGGPSPSTSAPPGPGRGSTSTSHPRSTLLPPVTIPIAAYHDPYAAGMSLIAALAGAGLVLALFVTAWWRTRRSARRHVAGHTLAP